MGEIISDIQDLEKTPVVNGLWNKEWSEYNSIKRLSNRNFEEKFSGPKHKFEFTSLSSLDIFIKEMFKLQIGFNVFMRFGFKDGFYKD